MERIGRQVREEKRVAFSSLFEGERGSRIVGVFLAILELLRHHGFRAEQPREYHEIWVLPPLDANTAQGPAAGLRAESTDSPSLAD